MSTFYLQFYIETKKRKNAIKFINETPLIGLKMVPRISNPKIEIRRVQIC